MTFDFTQTMKEATDADLVRIVTMDRPKYQPAAVTAAEAELAGRQLSVEQFDQAMIHNERLRQIDAAYAGMPLETHWKVLTFLFPGLIQFMLSGTYKAEGYDRKARELVRWTLFGFLFYAVALILLSGF